MPAVMLLGGATLSAEQGRAAGPANQRHRLALLTLLVLAHPRGVSRDRLVAYLWPEHDGEHGRNLLKQGVHALRTALGAEAILSAGDELSLDATRVECDVIAFEAALASGDLERAVRAYGGPLLDGFHLPRAAELEQRIDRERDRLRRRFVEALTSLAERAAARSDWTAAAELWRRIAAEDPFSGVVTTRLMQALDAAGDRAGALREARAHEERLRAELDTHPDQEVTRLADRLRKESSRNVVNGDRPPAAARTIGAARTVSASLTRYPLVGRDAEWERLRAVRASVTAGHSHFVLITGEAGIGKTRLAEALLDAASLDGADVARSRSYAAEGRLAYAPIADWLRSPMLRDGLQALDTSSFAEVARLLPELTETRADLPAPDPLTESWQRQRFFTGIARAVLGQRESLVLLIDDLQWCDEDSLQWLRYLLRFDGQTKLLVVGTARREEVGPDHPLRALAHDLGRDAQLTEIALGALSAEETATLAAHVAGRPLGDDAASLFAETEGHPLFVVESVRARGLDAPDGSGPATRSTSASTGGVPPVLPQVQAVIQMRLAQLSPSARRLAEIAATIGRDFVIEVLQRACDEADAPLEGLDELCARRIIREQAAGVFDFSHDKLREVAYAELGPVRRRALHARVAQALRLHHQPDLDPVSGRIAGHLERGGMLEEAIPFYQRAAEVAKAMFANEEAIAHLQRALALLEKLPQSEQRDRRELPLRIALLPALRAARGWAAEELGAAAASARTLSDHVGKAAERLRATLEMVSFQLVRGTDLRAALATAEEGLTLAVAQDDPCLLTTAHQLLGITLCQCGKFAEARVQLERAIALYDRGYHDRHVRLLGADFGVFSHSVAGHALWHLGHAEQAVRVSRDALTLAEELTHPFSHAIALAYDAMLHQFRGERDAVMERAGTVIDISRRQGFVYYRAWGTILIGWAVARPRDVERGAELIRDGMDAMRATGAELRRPYYLCLQAELCGAGGRPDSGLALVDDALTSAERSGELWRSAELHRLRGDLLLSQGADDEAVDSTYRRTRAIAERQGAWLPELRATISLAELLWRRRDGEEAAHVLRQSLARFDETLESPELSRARALLADMPSR